VALSNDKIWRVKLAIIEFIPLLSEFVNQDVFESKIIPLILGWLMDPVN
jgi:serine/threonine-protein phosphatase 2A regulatory subunit A